MAQPLGETYVTCSTQPKVTKVTLIQNPARFDWEPMSKIDCYRIGVETILKDH